MCVYASGKMPWDGIDSGRIFMEFIGKYGMMVIE